MTHSAGVNMVNGVIAPEPPERLLQSEHSDVFGSFTAAGKEGHSSQSCHSQMNQSDEVMQPPLQVDTLQSDKPEAKPTVRGTLYHDEPCLSPLSIKTAKPPCNVMDR
jgi:hypothetical protein